MLALTLFSRIARCACLPDMRVCVMHTLRFGGALAACCSSVVLSPPEHVSGSRGIERQSELGGRARHASLGVGGLQEYVQIVDLPEDLVKEIRASAEQCGRSAARDRMEEMIESLPYSLRQRVATRIFLPRFSTDIFKSCAQADGPPFDRVAKWPRRHLYCIARGRGSTLVGGAIRDSDK